MTQKLLLEDLTTKQISQDVSSLDSRKWSNLVIIQLLLDKYSIFSIESAKETLKAKLSFFYDHKKNHPKSSTFVVNLTELLLLDLPGVLASHTVELLLTKNLNKTKELLLNESLLLKSYKEVNNANQTANESYNINEASSSTITPKIPSSNKRQKYLKLSDFKDLSFEEKVVKLNENYGKSNVLDLTKWNVIPKRLKNITEKILVHYGLVLDTKLLNQEYDMLTTISNCKTIKELNDAVTHIDPFSEVSELPYIRLATHKLCNLIYRDLLTREHHEDWYRKNVYGNLFDFIFTSKAEYTTKRSKCHSTVIKRLKEQGALPESTKNIRIDFIFSHINNEITDGFFCEDKSTDKESSKDRKKVQYLREKSLQYWTTLLPYNSEIQHLTSISCQFNRLKLNIKATKIVAGITIHVILKEVRIPTDARDSYSIAEYLATVISLIRMVNENFDKIRIICDAAKEDDRVFANSILNIPCKDDSSISSQGSNLSDESEDLEVVEREIRVKRSIKEAMGRFEDELSKRYFNCTWEQITEVAR